MPKPFPRNMEGFNPFGDLVGITFTRVDGGNSRCVLEIEGKHVGPHKTIHGGVAYALADTGMGAAVYSIIDEDQQCSTVEIKVVYFKPAKSGTLTCETNVIHRSKRIAVLESEIQNDGQLIAKALGTFSMYKSRQE